MSSTGSNAQKYLVMLLTLVIMTAGCSEEPPITPDEPDDETPPTVTISFPADGASLLGSVIVRADASDDNGVARVEFYVDGSLQKTVSSPAWECMWDTRQSDNGPHTVFAKAFDRAGNTATSGILNVTVKNPYEYTFYNAVFTPIDLTVDGRSYVIPAGGSSAVQFPSDPGSFHYYAKTSGRTTQGTQVGELIEWENDITTSGPRSTELIISSKYFFLKINNKGYSVGGPLFVNYGLVDETADNISVPSGGIYNIGYYRAYSNTRVVMYLNGSSYYTYWDQGYHFILPFTQNQSVMLVNNNKTDRKEDRGADITSANRLEPVSEAIATVTQAAPAGCRQDIGMVRE